MNEIIPKIKPSAPLSLKKNIINKIKMEKNKMKKLMIKRLSATAALLAAILAVPFVFTANNEAKAAIRLLDESINKSDDLKTMEIKFLMQTTPDENFDALREDGSMLEHTFTISFENPRKWRLEKSGRTSLFDAVNSYSWLKRLGTGIMAPGIAGFFSDVEKFLDPQNLLRHEQQLAKDDGSEIAMQETGTQIILTIKSKAKGDFTNDYLKNSSIMESDNRRIYTFDKESKLLQAMQVQILYKNEYHTVFETTSILYNIPVDREKLTERPVNMEWTTLSDPSNNPALTGISSKEAARLIFIALANKNIEPVKEAFDYWDKVVIKKYYGLELLELGEAFKSGMYPGEFVPYKIKLPNGKIKMHNIALRNDNKNKVWMLDGGL
jgi:hypothetical protein